MKPEQNDSQLREAIDSQKTDAPTDRRDNKMEQSIGNEVSRTGREVDSRSTVPMGAEEAEDDNYSEQNPSGGV